MAYLGNDGLSKLWVRMKSYINNRIETLEQGVQMDLLWTNASPTSAMDAQTLSVNTSGYTHWAVLGRLTNNNPAQTLFIGKVGDKIIINFSYPSGSKAGNFYRNINYTSSSQIGVENGWVSTVTSDTNNTGSAIPVAIYGIKGVN